MNSEKGHPARVVIIGYAFNSLDPQQAQAVEAHLAECSECQAQVTQYQAKSEKAPAPAQAVESPAQPLQRQASSALPTRPLPRREPAPRLRLDRLHVVLAVAVLVLGLGNVLQIIQARTMRDEQYDLLRTIAANQAINALASESGMELLPVSGPQGQGSLLFEKDGAAGILFLRNLPNLDAGHTYQAWFIPASGSPISAGAFHANAGTPFASVLLNADRPIKSFQAINVTVEPVTGGQAPTTPPILLVQF